MPAKLALSPAVAGVVTATLTGDIDAHFEDVARSILEKVESGKLKLHCGGISRINSTGCGHLARMLETLQTRNVPVAIVDGAVILVEYRNVLPGAFQSLTFESFRVPFHCAKCRKGTEVLFETAKIGADHNITSACPKCGQPAAPAVDLSDYLAFLSE